MKRINGILWIKMNPWKVRINLRKQLNIYLKRKKITAVTRTYDKEGKKPETETENSLGE